MQFVKVLVRLQSQNKTVRTIYSNIFWLSEVRLWNKNKRKLSTSNN